MLFDAERTARRLHTDIVAHPTPELVRDLEAATRSALAGSDENEASVQLSRLAMLLGDLEGEKPVDLLIDILASTVTDARVVAGEALESIAFDRFKEIALGVERALGRLPKGSPALTELPYLLAEVAEPGCVKLLAKFLEHPDAEAAASAVEALAELGDPAAIPILSRFETDGRQVQLDGEGGEGERVSIGDLAHEARELLEEMVEAAAPQNEPPKKGKR